MPGWGSQENLTMNDKDLTEQTAEMLRSWSDAQRTMWEAWMEMANSTSKKAPSFIDIAVEWENLATQALQAWTSATDPLARRTAEQIIASQGVMLRFVDFAARAWETTAPKIKSGDEWQEAFFNTIEQLRKSWLGLPAQTVAITEDMDALWKLYLDQWRAFGQPWENVLNKSPALLGRAASGESAAMFELSSAYQEAYQQTIGRLAGSPNLGMTREFTSRMQEGFDAFVAWNLASVEYQAVISEIWDATFKQFGEELVIMAEKGEKVESVRDLVMLWTRGGEQTFLGAFQSERYTLAQGKLLNATMQYRICQRRIIEKYLEMFDLPTRSEVDEAHRRIYELSKEVKTLKKKVSTLESKGETAKINPKPKRQPAQRKKEG